MRKGENERNGKNKERGWKERKEGEKRKGIIFPI